MRMQFYFVELKICIIRVISKQGLYGRFSYKYLFLIDENERQNVQDSKENRTM